MSFETKDYGQVFAKGVIRDHEKHRALKLAAPKHEHVVSPVLPAQFSVGDKTSPCENQGSCGSCWDFGITKGLRSAWMLAGKDPGRLSFNYLLLNVGPVHEYGCGGGDFDAGQNMLNGMGPCLYDLSPYTGSDRGSYPKNAAVAATAKKWVLVGNSNSAPSAQQLAEALYNEGRGNYLVVDVAADNGWSSYSGGIYNRNGSRSINHIINCVGYNAETSVDANGKAVFNADGSFKNGDGYFILRNNWGASWGENGDMRSRYGCNNWGETAMYFEVDAPVPPPVPPVPPVPPGPTPPGPSLPAWAWVVIGALAATAIVLGAVLSLKK
jgi:C1A family cysteine protease